MLKKKNRAFKEMKLNKNREPTEEKERRKALKIKEKLNFSWLVRPSSGSFKVQYKFNAYADTTNDKNKCKATKVYEAAKYNNVILMSAVRTVAYTRNFYNFINNFISI